MTTLIPFAPSLTAIPPFQATVTLDGNQYNLKCAWNYYRSDWYYTITDQANNVLIAAALVGSSPGGAIYLAPGVFMASTILYRPSTGNFEISP